MVRNRGASHRGLEEREADKEPREKLQGKAGTRETSWDKDGTLGPCTHTSPGRSGPPLSPCAGRQPRKHSWVSRGPAARASSRWTRAVPGSRDTCCPECPGRCPRRYLPGPAPPRAPGRPQKQRPTHAAPGQGGGHDGRHVTARLGMRCVGHAHRTRRINAGFARGAGGHRRARWGAPRCSGGANEWSHPELPPGRPHPKNKPASISLKPFTYKL